MTEHAHGTFEVTLTPQPSDDGIGRFELTKTWSGDLTGTGHGLMLSAGDPGRQAPATSRSRSSTARSTVASARSPSSSSGSCTTAGRS